MLHLLRSNRNGITLIEVIIAMGITSVCVLGLISMQPHSWNLVSRADYLNRAAGILNAELEKAESLVLNPECDISEIAQTEKPISCGNLGFTVTTTVEDAGSLFFSMKVVVKWPGNPTGISGSRRITRQELFRRS